MIPHDSALDAAYGTSAWAPYTRVTLYSPTTTGGETQVVPDTVEGTLTLSDTNWPRATLELSIPAGVTAADTVVPVSQLGGRAVVEFGATIGGSRYVFQACDLDVSEVFLERPSNMWTIRAVSQEARVNEAVPVLPISLWDYATSLGTGKTSEGVRAVVSDAMPGYDRFYRVYPASVSLATDVTLTVQDDYVSTYAEGLWDMLEGAMDATGGEAYFRYDRRLVLRTIPVIGSPVQTLKVGTGGTLLAYRDVTRWARNAVMVNYYRRSNDTLLIGSWEQTTGPKRVSGPYGRHTRVINKTVPTLPTQARANARAASIGKRVSAPFRRVELDCVPAPWLEPGDTVAVQLVEGSLTNMLVSGVRIPLSQLEPMTVTMHDAGL